MLNNERIEILKNELNLDLNSEIIEKANLWFKVFIEYNSHTNLLSRNEVSLLFEKHVFDSLALSKLSQFQKSAKILDVGTGGGFPSVILAIFFKDKKIIANDSRIKKINFIKEIKEKLNLENLEILYGRIEEQPSQFADIIVSRAVGKIIDVFELSKKHLSKTGCFAIYKSKNSDIEICAFKKKYKNIKINTIDYLLPLEEKYERKLISFSGL